MKFAATITAFAAFASTALAQAITVASPPNFLTCQPNQVSWTGGSGPYFVSVLPGGQSGGTPLADLGEQQSSPYVWNVNVAAGQSVTIRVSDQQGNVQYSSPIPVIAGSSTSCVGQPLTGTTAGSTVAVASSAASSAASAAASSAAASTTGAAASSAASSASSAAASSVISSASSSASSAAAATTMMSSSAAASSNRASTTAAGSSTVAPASASSTAANAAATQVIGGAGAVLIGAIGAVAALF